MVVRWVFGHGRCVYDAFNEEGIMDAMFVNGGAIWLYTDDTKGPVLHCKSL